MPGPSGRGCILVASEMPGAVRGINLDNGLAWDDTRKYVDQLNLGPGGLP